MALPKGFGSAEFRRSITSFFGLIEAFQPSMIFISAGFDAHVKDPLGGLTLTPTLTLHRASLDATLLLETLTSENN